MENLELAYSPQYGAAKDPLNIAGNVAVNLLEGEEDFVYAEDLAPGKIDKWTILDVREDSEHQAGYIPGAHLVSLSSQRQKLQQIPRDKPIAVYCAVGQRAYYATRILRAQGIKASNIAGGYSMYKLVNS